MPVLVHTSTHQVDKGVGVKVGGNSGSAAGSSGVGHQGTAEGGGPSTQGPDARNQAARTRVGTGAVNDQLASLRLQGSDAPLAPQRRASFSAASRTESAPTSSTPNEAAEPARRSNARAHTLSFDETILVRRFDERRPVSRSNSGESIEQLQDGPRPEPVRRGGRRPRPAAEPAARPNAAPAAPATADRWAAAPAQTQNRNVAAPRRAADANEAADVPAAAVQRSPSSGAGGAPRQPTRRPDADGGAG